MIHCKYVLEERDKSEGDRGIGPGEKVGKRGYKRIRKKDGPQTHKRAQLYF